MLALHSNNKGIGGVLLNFKYIEKELSTKTLESNIGQIPEVHENPRTITKDEYQKLKNSIERNGIIKARSPIVYEHEGRFVVICGNMRLKASKELGLATIPVFLIDETLTPEQLNELDIIDNKQNGDWDYDMLANEWPQEQLQEWGISKTLWSADALDLTDISSTEDRTIKPQTRKVTCPNCEHQFEA